MGAVITVDITKILGMRIATLLHIGAATKDAARDIPGRIDGFLNCRIAGMLEQIDELGNLGEAIAVQGAVNCDDVIWMWQRIVTVNVDVGHFGDALIETLVVCFCEQIDERFERGISQESAEQGAGIFGAADVAFDFVPDEATERTAVDGFSGRNNELRFAARGFVASVDGRSNLLIDDTFPRFETVEVEDFQETFADIRGVQFHGLEIRQSFCIKAGSGTIKIGARALDAIVTERDETSRRLAIDADDGLLGASIVFGQDTGGDFGGENCVADARFKNAENG